MNNISVYVSKIYPCGLIFEMLIGFHIWRSYIGGGEVLTGFYSTIFTINDIHRYYRKRLFWYMYIKKKSCLMSGLKFTLSDVTSFLKDNLSGLEIIIFRSEAIT